MDKELITCCVCDEQRPAGDARRIKTNGLEQSFHICSSCLEDVPLLKEQLEEMELPLRIAI